MASGGSTKFWELFGGSLVGGVDQWGSDEEMSPETAWFQVHESNGSFEARKEFHGCGRISVCVV